MLIKYWIKEKSHLLLICSLIAAYLILINCLNGIYSIKRSNILKYSDESLYYICDNFVGAKEAAFFDDQNCISKLKQFHDWLSNNKDFDYLCTNNQTIGINNMDVKSLQVNSLFFEKNDINIIGENFDENDYEMESLNDEIPILMGDNYTGKYNIGDKVEFYYLGSNKFTGVVKGFISKESCYKDKDNVYPLNDKMIIPLLEFEKSPKERSEWSFQLRLYLEKNAGIIISNYPAAYIQSIIDSECAQLQMEPYIIQNNAAYNLDIWGLSGNNLLYIYVMFVIFFSIMLVIILSLEMVEKLVRLRRKFSIAYYSGYSERHIVSSIITGVCIEIFKPFIIAVIIDICIFRSIHIYPVLAGILVLMLLMVSSCLLFVHKKILFDVRGTRYGNNKT